MSVPFIHPFPPSATLASNSHLPDFNLSDVLRPPEVILDALRASSALLAFRVAKWQLSGPPDSSSLVEGRMEYQGAADKESHLACSKPSCMDLPQLESWL